MKRSLLFLMLLVGILPAEAQPTPPYMPVLDVSALDTSVNACDNFYQYACGGWHAANPMPPDATFWSRPFTQFSRRVDAYVQALIEEAAHSDRTLTLDEQRVGDYYASCMDTTAIDARGLTPLIQEWELIDQLNHKEDLPSVLGRLHKSLAYAPNEGEPLVFIYAYSGPEEGGQAVRLWIGPNGMALGGRDYYISPDSAYAAMRGSYQEHLAQMLALFGYEEDVAGPAALQIFELEKALAMARLPNSVIRNDASVISNPFTPDELSALSPNFNWQAFFKAHELPEVDRIIVREPAYMTAVDSLVQALPLATWKAYLHWQLINDRVKLLPAVYRQAQFNFFGRKLEGLTAMPSREQQCISHAKRDLQEAIGRVFVAQVFDPQQRTQMAALFDEIKAVMRRRIQTADWMAPETKKEAYRKLDAVRLSVGHPIAWIDDPSVPILRDDFYGNLVRTAEAARRVNFAGLDLPANLDAWGDPTMYIGAGYMSRTNAIRVTAGMMLLYEQAYEDPALLYGGLGALLAHELIHGFDPYGRSFDEVGRLRDWWTEDDGRQFNERSQCVADHFSQLEYAPGIPIDGSFVVSEQVSEISAWDIAWEAYLNAVGNGEDIEAGFTPQQRFLLSNAQLWCTEATDETWRFLAAGSSSKAWAAPMVNGTAMHFPGFREAFSCTANQPMVLPSEKVCKIW